MRVNDMGLWCRARAAGKGLVLCPRQVAAAFVEGSGEDCSCLGGFHAKLTRGLSVLSKPRAYLPVPHDTRVLKHAFSHAQSLRFTTSSSQSCIYCASQRMSGDSKFLAIGSNTLSRSSPNCCALFNNFASQHLERLPRDGLR